VDLFAADAASPAEVASAVVVHALDGVDAAALAAQLRAHGDGAFWADGGRDDDPPYAPGRHLLAAFPDRVERLSVEALPQRALVPWLRERLPAARPGAPLSPLTVVALAYDAGRNLEALPATALADPPLPDVVLARYPAFLDAPGERGPWTLHGPPEARARLLAALGGAAPPPAALPPLAFSSSMDPAAHAAAPDRILAGIAAGDLYQANVARRLEAALDLAPALAAPAAHAALRAGNPAAFGALWALDADTWLASSSPECLFTFEPATRTVHSYPIKGTRPRGATPAEDGALAAALVDADKDRAEHVMIVDLVRNDLGRIAAIGSVEVARRFDVMTLPTVHHLVSDVRATLAAERDLADLVAALFPGGSITGAPKIAAMAAIEAVEGLRRGFYTGSLGVVTGDGAATFSILIRTAVLADGRLFYATGGGIVADSDPACEWDETVDKAAALVRALGSTAARPAP